MPGSPGSFLIFNCKNESTESSTDDALSSLSGGGGLLLAVWFRVTSELEGSESCTFKRRALIGLRGWGRRAVLV